MDNNTFLSSCSFNHSGYDQLVWQIGAFFFPVIGLPGHVLMIMTILSTMRQNFHPVSFYFIFISLHESIYLIFIFWDWLDAINIAPDPRKILDCGFFYPFVSGTSVISLILIVQLNLDRIYMIQHPNTHNKRITNKRILLKIFLSSSVSILFVINYQFSVTYDPQAFVIFGQACRVYSRAKWWFLSVWPYLQLVSRLIPCLLLIICTIYICLNRNRTKKIGSIHRRQQTFSKVLVAVSFYTFLAVVPITILQLFNQRVWQYEMDYLRYNCERDQRRANHWKLANAIFIMWEASSHVSKFYIRLVCSSEFRQDVKRLFFTNHHRLSNRIGS